MQHSMSGLDTYDQAAVMADQPRYAMDSKLYVKFYTRPVMHGFKSNEAGRPIYEDKEYIQIIVPGDSKTTVDCPVTAEFRAASRSSTRSSRPRVPGRQRHPAGDVAPDHRRTVRRVQGA